MRRRALASFALVSLAAVPIAWPSTSSWKTSMGHSPRVMFPMSVERETGCPGQWRWSVKTLTETPDSSSVNFSSKVKTVAELGDLAKPSVPINNHTLYVPRQPGPEMKTYRVKAVLVKMRKETDGDIHLVIADPGPNGKRMVAEFPKTNCPPASTSPRRPDIETARKTLTDHCGSAPSFKKGMLKGTVTVKGVGFFDFKHAGDQADNGIELHPVVKPTNLVCERVSS